MAFPHETPLPLGNDNNNGSCNHSSSCLSLPDACSFEQGALAFRRLTLTQAILLIVGADVGAAILSLPYAARAAGYPGAVAISVVTSVFAVISHLYIVEIMLRTKQPGQLVGLMRTYMFGKRQGQFFVWLVSVLTIGLVIPSLASYVIGGGAIIAALFRLPQNAGILLFLIPGALIVWLGLSATAQAQQSSSIAMGASLLLFTAASAVRPEFNLARLSAFAPASILAALPVGIYTSMSQTIVPEVVRGLAHDPKLIPKAVKWGLGINLAFLILFPIAIFGLQDPSAISEVVTISWGRALGPVVYLAVNVFALLALITSFWGSAGAALGNVIEILKLQSEWDIRSRLAAFAITVTPSLLISVSGRFGFLDMISAAGAVGGVILAVLPVFVLARARQCPERIPEYQVGILFHPWVRATLIFFYVGALICAAVSQLAR